MSVPGTGGTGGMSMPADQSGGGQSSSGGGGGSESEADEERTFGADAQGAYARFQSGDLPGSSFRGWDFTVRGQNPTMLRGTYLWEYGDGGIQAPGEGAAVEDPLYYMETQLGSTPFTAGFGFDAGVAPAWGFGLEGQLSNPITEYPTTFTGVGKSVARVDFNASAFGTLGVGAANFLSAGLKLEAGGELRFQLDGQIQAEGQINENSAGGFVPTSPWDFAAGLNGRAQLYFDLDVGFYVQAAGSMMDWMVNVGRYEFAHANYNFSKLEAEWGENGLEWKDDELMTGEGGDWTINPPTGPIIDSYDQMIAYLKGEDDKARRIVKELKEKGMLDQASPRRKAELVEMIMDTFVVGSSETRIAELVEASSTYEARLVLIHAYYEEYSEYPQYGEDIENWIDGSIGGEQLTRIYEAVGGSSFEDFLYPPFTQGYIEEDRTFGYALEREYLDYYRRNPMKAEYDAPWIPFD